MLNIAGGAAATGYNLTRSLRFRASASAYLNRTPAAGNRQIWTWSAWVKRGSFGGDQYIFRVGIFPNLRGGLFFDSQNNLRYLSNPSGSSETANLISTAVYRDPSAWYHVVLALDSTQATAANRVKLYVNGVQVTAFGTATYPPLNENGSINAASIHYIGRDGASVYFDGYLAEINFIDGQALTPASFGSTNALTGVWQPAAYVGTYGTNGFYLPFTDNSSATPAGLGKDFSGATTATIVCSTTSGSTTMTVATLTGVQVGSIVTGTGIPANTYVVSTGVLSVTLSQAATSTNAGLNYVFSGNNWTTNNISITAGVTYDSMTDVPTLTNATTANYAVLNPLQRQDAGYTTAITNGNLAVAITYSSGANMVTVPSTIKTSPSGKWYWEVTVTSALSGGSTGVGVITPDSYVDGVNPPTSNYLYVQSGNKIINNTSTAYGATFTNGDVIGIALDVDAGTITFYKNNASQGVASTGLAATSYYAVVTSNATGTRSYAINFGQRPFAYTPPTGFVALNTFNLPASTILKGNTVMDATLYTGTGASLAVTNAASFQPDLVWMKGRSGATDHALYDSVRGVQNQLESNTTTAETAEATGLTAFGSGGFTVGALAQVNTSAATYVGWQWKGGGAAVSNTNGTITSSVSANASAGFSIATYTGTGANATIGHGLGVAPKMIIVKRRSATGDWQVYQAANTANPETDYLVLNTTAATADAADRWDDTAPTSSVFSIGNGATVNASAATYVAYCWSEIDGFSKFGSYTGNGSSDGPFVYLGFRAKWVMIKNASDGTRSWYVYDSVRDTYNVVDSFLLPNLNNAEGAAVAAMDFLSNGFKIRDSAAYVNGSGNTIIYAAFAENPFRNSLAR